MTNAKNIARLALVALLVAGSRAWAQERSAPEGKKASAKKSAAKKETPLNVIFETSMGKIVCKLYEKETPITVANFVGLAEGTKEWTDPATGQKTKKKFYDGLIFHRVIPNFMIQGGDPLGSGMGGPGYQFDDEIVPSLTFNRPGLLAMANAGIQNGQGTNGSQFFITTVPTPGLNGIHAIFGEVIEGQDVVVAIGNVARNSNNRPNTPVVMKKVMIQRKK